MWVLPKQAMSSVSTLSPHAKHLAMSVRTEVPATHFQSRVCPGGPEKEWGSEAMFTLQSGWCFCLPSHQDLGLWASIYTWGLYVSFPSWLLRALSLSQMLVEVF